MGHTTISNNLKKTTAVLLKDGTVLEGINYAQFRAGVQPQTSEPVQEETVEEKRARLQAELDALN